MRYMGSKARIAKYIMPFINIAINQEGVKSYIEPFCGGCNMIDTVNSYLSENNLGGAY